MTAPEATVCPTCEGYGVVIHSLNGDVGLMGPCYACCCEVCGRPTDTPPICAECDVAQDAAYERRADV